MKKIYLNFILNYIFKITLIDCNVTVKGYQGAIEIVGYDNMTPVNCQWTIMASKRSKLNITFTSFKIVTNPLRRIDLFRQLNKNLCNNTQLSVSTKILYKHIFKSKYLMMYLMYIFLINM